jgi:FtsH-binding integral membrane protein
MKKYSNKHGYLITIISLMLCSFFFKKDFDFFNFIGYFIGILIIAIFISSIISSFVNFKYFGKVIGITSVFISIFLLLPHINNQSIKHNGIHTKGKYSKKGII